MHMGITQFDVLWCKQLTMIIEYYGHKSLTVIFAKSIITFADISTNWALVTPNSGRTSVEYIYSSEKSLRFIEMGLL